MPKKKRTNLQNKIIHQLVGKWDFTRDDKAEMVFDITNGRTASTKEMYFDEANEMIHRLQGQPVTESRRTVNHRNQKAGVESIATATHRDFMNQLVRGRNITKEGLEKLSARVNSGVKNPRTSKEVNRIIEAIKQMNRRDKTNAQSATGDEQKEAA